MKKREGEGIKKTKEEEGERCRGKRGKGDNGIGKKGEGR